LNQALYCDANAGIAVTQPGVDAYRQAQDLFANPSSVYLLGRNAGRALAQARQDITALLQARASQVVFTSGGSEANALALVGVIQASHLPCPHVLSTQIEHPSVVSTLKRLEHLGKIRLSLVAACRDGRVAVANMLDALEPDTVLVSMVALSNETGVEQPVCDLAAALKGHPARLHVDGVQAVGRQSIDFENLGVDLLSLSGHKFGSIAGVGALVFRRDIHLQGLIKGGAQEFGLRAGTQHVAGALSCVAALKWALSEQIFQNLLPVRDRFEQALRTLASQRGIDMEIIGQPSPRAANTSCVRFVGCEGDFMMMALDMEGIAVSTGSACSSGSIEASPVLLGMGMSASDARQVLRFSFNPGTPSDTVERLVRALDKILVRLKS
jgi:cysteine desulfurase